MARRAALSLVISGLILGVCLSLILIVPIDIDRIAFADSQPAATLLFQQVVTANNGSRYLVGEVQNIALAQNIESTTFFSKSDLNDSYYTQDIGIVPKGMGIPFKIDLQLVEKQTTPPLNLSDFKIVSQYTHMETNSLLEVNYSSLYTDPQTHTISGLLDNKSPTDSFSVRVLAIALDSHLKPLDVVQSDIIHVIQANSSAHFKLVPLDSVAKRVSLYSCFVPTSAGLSYNVSAGNGQTMQLLFDGDGKIKNLHYDPQYRKLTFTAQGIFLGGGTEEGMILKGPDSFTSSKLALMVNGKNITNGVEAQLVGGEAYKHFEFSFPFGNNKVSVQAIPEVPEFPAVPVALVGAIGFVVFFNHFFRKR